MTAAGPSRYIFADHRLSSTSSSSSWISGMTIIVPDLRTRNIDLGGVLAVDLEHRYVSPVSSITG
jgi:hypothetical protein